MTSTNQITDAEMAARVAARQVRERDAQRRFAAIAAPADATVVSPWTEWDHILWVRCFTGRRAVIDNVTVEVIGSQYSDGTVERTVRVYGGGLDSLNAVTAVDVAEAMLQAARTLIGGAE